MYLVPDSALSGSRGDETRERIRTATKSSTYVTASLIGFKDITPELHLDMCNWIDQAKPQRGYNRLLGVIPRDHLKSSNWTIANSVNRIIRNPSIRILIGNETATNAQHFLRRIQAVWDRNPMFRWAFSELIPDPTKPGKWSETEMLIPRSEDYAEATVETIGVGGAVVSRHYNLIKLDDLVGKEASESDDKMKKTIDWYQYCESLLNDPKEEIHTVGTPWGNQDLIAWILKHEGDYLLKYITGCYKADGTPIWPERFPIEELERIRSKYGSFKFSCQYLCEPSDPEQTSFHSSWLRFYRPQGDGFIEINGVVIPISMMNRFIQVDPAISEDPGAARTAVLVVGVLFDGRKFVLESWMKRCQPLEMVEKIFDLTVKYDPISVGIEAVAYQKALQPFIEAEALRRGVWLNIVLYKTDTHTRKINRIRGALQPEFERGQIWFNPDMDDLCQEYIDFPTGATIDGLDALAYGNQQWIVPEFEAVDDDNVIDAELATDELNGRSMLTGY